MKIICKEIRENARISLKGKWTIIALCTLLYGNLSDIIDFIPSKDSARFSIMLTLVSTALFIFGYNNIILQITRGNKIEFITFFSGCKRALRGFRMIMLVGVYTLLWSILLVIPGIIAMIKYSMAYFIWVDNPNMRISDAISESVDMTYGHKGEIFKLFLSFIGWFLLLIALSLGIEFIIGYYITNSILLIENCSLIIFLIGFLYLETYFKVSMGVLYNKLIKFNKIEQTRQLD